MLFLTIKYLCGIFDTSVGDAKEEENIKTNIENGEKTSQLPPGSMCTVGDCS